MFEEIKANTEKKMEGAISALHNELKGLRVGRATPDMLNPVTVAVYEGRFKINQLANIGIPEPRMIVIQVWNHNNVDQITKAITNSNLGLSPITEGSVIRIIIPEMSEERRKEMTQVVYKCAEQTKVSVRNIRRDSIGKLKQIKNNIPEDEYHDYLESVQKITDNMIVTIDQMSKKKQEDILSV